MAQRPVNRRTQKGGGSRYAALAVLVLILLAVTGYIFFARPTTVSETKSRQQKEKYLSANQQNPPTEPSPAATKPPSEPQQTPPLQKPAERYPADQPVEPAVKEAVSPGADTRTGTLAIIIDDMGSSMDEARSLAAIGVPLTFSIIPGLRHYREVAAFAAKSNVETMIHIPMQSKGWPQRRLESNGLLVSMTEQEIRRQVDSFIRELPNAVGANNHMGSEFTEHDDAMRVVLQVLKEHHLFFVDSVTSPATAGFRLARELDIQAARRGVFLDNEQNDAYIRGQLQQAIRRAKKEGGVIAICHPHPATIATLARQLPLLKSQGITLVAASKIVR